MSTRKVWEHDNAEYRQESADYLRTLFPPGSEVTTTIKHVTRSGMGRVIAVIGYNAEKGRVLNVSHDVARVLGWRYDNDRRGVFVDGCGMDMAFHLTYTLSRALYAASDGGERSGYLLNQNTI
jgi:hypothetical protein